MDDHKLFLAVSQDLMAKSLQMSTQDPTLAMRLARLSVRIALHLKGFRVSPWEPRKSAARPFPATEPRKRRSRPALRRARTR